MTYYTIMPGDTLYKIAEKYHLAVPAIMAANPGLYPYNLLVGQRILLPVESAMPEPAMQGGNPQAVSANELTLRNTLRELWEQHVAWTRMTIMSAAAGSPDLDAVVARLLRNSADMAAALQPFYGAADANTFGSLIRQHLTIALQLVNAAKAGDTQAAQNAEKQWYANAEQIANFLGAINPYIDRDAFRRMLYTHLALTKAEALAQLNHDYAKSIALYDQIEDQALTMADTMAAGIVRQFPAYFK